MSFGTAHRSTQHVMGFTNNPVYTPVWRVVAALVVAASVDGRLHHCYGGDTLDGSTMSSVSIFALGTRGGDPRGAGGAGRAGRPRPLMRRETLDAAAPDSDAVLECSRHAGAPTGAGTTLERAPACRTGTLRGNDCPLFQDAVVAAGPSGAAGTRPGQEQLTLTVRRVRPRRGPSPLNNLPPPLGSSAAARPAADDHRRLRRRTRAWRGAGGNNLGGNDDGCEDVAAQRQWAQSRRRSADRHERPPGTVPGAADVGAVAAGVERTLRARRRHLIPRHTVLKENGGRDPNAAVE